MPDTTTAPSLETFEDFLRKHLHGKTLQQIDFTEIQRQSAPSTTRRFPGKTDSVIEHIVFESDMPIVRNEVDTYNVMSLLIDAFYGSLGVMVEKHQIDVFILTMSEGKKDRHFTLSVSALPRTGRLIVSIEPWAGE